VLADKGENEPVIHGLKSILYTLAYFRVGISELPHGITACNSVV
jgi:hypothetical protein